MLSSSGVAEFRPESREPELLPRLRGQEPEEAVMLDADLPQPLGRAMVAQLEADRRLELLELARPELNEEPVPLVRDLDDLGPGEAVDPEAVAVDEDAGRADAQHDVDVLRVLGVVEAHAVHGKLLRVLQVVELGLGRRLTLQKINHSTNAIDCHFRFFLP